MKRIEEARDIGSEDEAVVEYEDTFFKMPEIEPPSE